jgi:hypothetical protein
MGNDVMRMNGKGKTDRTGIPECYVIAYRRYGRKWAARRIGHFALAGNQGGPGRIAPYREMGWLRVIDDCGLRIFDLGEESLGGASHRASAGSFSDLEPRAMPWAVVFHPVGHARQVREKRSACGE